MAGVGLSAADEGILAPLPKTLPPHLSQSSETLQVPPSARALVAQLLERLQAMPVSSPSANIIAYLHSQREGKTEDGTSSVSNARMSHGKSK